MQTTDTTKFERAADASMDTRPGVPEERNPEPVGNAHWLQPEKQTPGPRVIKDAGRREFTATFGTNQPPRGISGVIRRAAYRVPDYEAKRWGLLMLADRVDELESSVGRALASPAVWAAVVSAVVVGAGARAKRAKSRSWFGRRGRRGWF
jgi:hypothetical protein